MQTEKGIILKEKVILADINNNKHREDIQKMFVEYASVSGSDIDEKLAEKLFELPYFKGFICYEDDVPFGFAVCYDSFSSYKCKQVLNIHDFMISSSHRGKGHGKILMRAIERFSHDNNYLKITLEVNESNLNAKKLYASFGFEDYRNTLKEQLHWQKYLSN